MPMVKNMQVSGFLECMNKRNRIVSFLQTWPSTELHSSSQQGKDGEWNYVHLTSQSTRMVQWPGHGPSPGHPAALNGDQVRSVVSLPDRFLMWWNV
ncbi:hypothetical protein SRHO_G00302240 [Serrasalmus rhombeus]